MKIAAFILIALVTFLVAPAPGATAQVTTDDPIVFDFESEPGTFTATEENRVRPGVLTSLTMSKGGLSVTITRPGSRFDILRKGGPSAAIPSHWGVRTLDPFVSNNSNDFVATFSQPVTFVSLEGGDFGGEAQEPNGDLLQITAYGEANGAGSIVASDVAFYAGTSAFPVTTQATVEHQAGIRSIRFFGGSNGFPMSLFFDNLTVKPKVNLIHSVEFTQAIQVWQTLDDLKADLNGDGQPPIPMVAGKPAAMRVYFEQAQSVAANYQVQVSGAFAQSLPVSVNGICTPEDRRRQASGCWSADFNFTPPTGDWTVTLQVRNNQGDLLEEHSFTLRSVNTRTLQIRVLDVCDDLDNELCGQGSDLEQQASFLRAIYPGTVNIQRRTTQIRNHATGVTEDWWIGVLNDLQLMWENDGANAEVYFHGAVRQQQSALNGRGRRPGNVAAARLGHANVAQSWAHETNHNFGRQHVVSNISGCFATPEGLDPSWPHATPALDEVGFDVATGTVRLPDTFKDLMSYCNPRWVSLYGYQWMLNLASQGVSASATRANAVRTEGDFWIVSGSVEGNVATFAPVLTKTMTGNTGPGAGTYALQARGAGDAVLFNRQFSLAEDSEGTAPPTFIQSIPVQPGSTRIVVLNPQAQIIGSVSLQGQAPTVAVGAPDADRTVIWSVTDSDSSSHTYSIDFSADGGATWVPLVPSTLETSLDLDSVSLPGTLAAVVRVTATDGALSGSGMSPVFATSSQPPAVAIVAMESDTFAPGDLVWLQAAAFDAEDGALDGASLTWTSSLDGVIGTGSDLPFYNLSVGSHTITVRALDSDSQQATDTVTVTVTDEPIEESGYRWGDVDCSREVGATDVVRLLQGLTGTEAWQSGCPEVTDAVDIDSAERVWGDFDCDGQTTVGDALALRRYLAGLGSPPAGACPSPGASIIVE